VKLPVMYRVSELGHVLKQSKELVKALRLDYNSSIYEMEKKTSMFRHSRDLLRKEFDAREKRNMESTICSLSTKGCKGELKANISTAHMFHIVQDFTSEHRCSVIMASLLAASAALEMLFPELAAQQFGEFVCMGTFSLARATLRGEIALREALEIEFLARKFSILNKFNYILRMVFCKFYHWIQGMGYPANYLTPFLWICDEGFPQIGPAVGIERYLMLIECDAVISLIVSLVLELVCVFGRNENGERCIEDLGTGNCPVAGIVSLILDHGQHGPQDLPLEMEFDFEAYNRSDRSIQPALAAELDAAGNEVFSNLPNIQPFKN